MKYGALVVGFIIVALLPTTFYGTDSHVCSFNATTSFDVPDVSCGWCNPVGVCVCDDTSIVIRGEYSYGADGVSCGYESGGFR